MEPINGYNFYQNNDGDAIQSESMNSILTSTFFRMFLGLFASAITAFYVYSSGTYVKMIDNGYFSALFIIELIVVVVFSLGFKKLSSTAVTVLFYSYAFINGFTLSVVFAVYEMTSIGYAFLATAALFGVLSYIGYTTKKDISNFGTMLTVALVIGLVLTIINIFIGSTVLDLVLDWAMLGIFLGLTVWDINKIKDMRNMGICEDEKLYIYGAMELYLDFINIFLRILSLFGRRRN